MVFCRVLTSWPSPAGCWRVLACGLLASYCVAETGVLVLHVQDANSRPIAGVQIGVKGDGGSAITQADGKARIALAKDTKAMSWVSLQILASPPTRDYIIISPWMGEHTQVPSFENESGNFVEVIVVRRGSLDDLRAGRVVRTTVAHVEVERTKKLEKQYQPWPEMEKQSDDLAKVARAYGITTNQLDEIIRDWASRTKSSYDSGLAALYAKDYKKAVSDFEESLGQPTRQSAPPQDVADTAFFLGSSFLRLGKFAEAVKNFELCLQFRPYDLAALDSAGYGSQWAEDYKGAETYYRQALRLREQTIGARNPDVASNLRNLGEVLAKERYYVEAEAFLKQALTIEESSLGQDHPDVGRTLLALGFLMHEQGNLTGAEPYYQRALAIDEKALGPNDIEVSADLHNFAWLLADERKYDQAEQLFQRSIAIKESQVGPNHLFVAIGLCGLAWDFEQKGDYARAEALLQRALDIYKTSLGADSAGARDVQGALDRVRREASDHVTP